MKWDKGLSYEQLKDTLMKAFRIKLSDYMLKPGKRKAKFLVYVATGMIQLANGMRAGEAMIAFRKWLDEDKDEFEIWVFKQRAIKREKDGRIIEKKDYELTKRFVKIPNFLVANKFILREAFWKAFPNPDNFIPKAFEDPRYRKKHFKEYKKYTSKYEKFWENNFRINTHNFRYAWQNRVLGLLPAELVAKIQGRKNFDIILDYLREKVAKEKLKEVVDF